MTETLKIIANNLTKTSNSTANSAFWSLVQKEVADHVRSWRVIILIGIIFLTCVGSTYTAISNFDKLNEASKNTEDVFFFLRLFTLSDGTLPSFLVFIGFLGPLMGIGLGFDAVNSEQSNGTLSRILAQPIHRDFIINAKFLGSLIVVAALFFTLTFMVMGVGLIALGIPPTAEEFVRIILYTFLSIVYVALWLNLSILFSIRFKQSATSALAGIAVWLFFTIFYPMIVNMISKGFEPSQYASSTAVYFYQKMKFGLMQLMPNQLFNEATSTLLTPSVRNLGPLTMEQVDGAIPGVLPLDQSILVVWPQITGLLAMTILCFLFGYLLFMRREIRSR
ncbi:MAG: ABC transporter permease [Cyclobacteriaceae bacterium]